MYPNITDDTLRKLIDKIPYVYHPLLDALANALAENKRLREENEILGAAHEQSKKYISQLKEDYNNLRSEMLAVFDVYDYKED